MHSSLSIVCCGPSKANTFLQPTGEKGWVCVHKQTTWRNFTIFYWHFYSYRNEPKCCNEWNVNVLNMWSRWERLLQLKVISNIPYYRLANIIFCNDFVVGVLNALVTKSSLKCMRSNMFFTLLRFQNFLSIISLDIRIKI